MLIYKICGADEWREAEQLGLYAGSADDARDGFIHFSTHEQLRGTLDKHFAGRKDLVLIAVDDEGLGEVLKWESSRGVALFPHLYSALNIAAVCWVKSLPLGDNGTHDIPEI